MNQAEPPTSAPPNPSRVRLRPLVVIVVLTGLAIACLWLFTGERRDIRTLGTLVSVAIGAQAVVFWFALFSGLRASTRITGIVALVALLAIVFRLFRIDGYDGDMVPIVVWRSTPTAEQQFSAGPADNSGDHATDVVSGSTAGSPVADTTADPVDLTGLLRGDFPGFLGADRLGSIDGLKLQTDWTAHPPQELWRRPVGLGWSGFVVAGDLAVTQEQRGEQEVVVGYDLTSGQQRWVHADNDRFSEALGGDGPRATPTIHNGRVYALGAGGLLNCLTADTGKRLWSVNILEDNSAANIDWGMAGSPLVVDDLVVVSPGGADGRSLVAYASDDGSRAWSSGSDPAAYASPQLTELAGIRQVLHYSAVAVSGHDPASGNLLWRFPWASSQTIKCSQPVVPAEFGNSSLRDHVLLSSGYGVGSVLLKLEQVDEQLRASTVWESQQLDSKFSNLVVHGDFLYGLDGGILACLDLKDGQRRWKRGRYGHGQMLLVDDLLLIQAEDGDMVLVQATPDAHQELARHPALSSKTWNNLALAGQLLLVRNDREAACYQLPVK